MTKRERFGLWFGLSGLFVLCLSQNGCMNEEPDSGELSASARKTALVNGSGDPRALCEFAVYGTQRADIRDRGIVQDGPVGSGYYVETGSNARILANVESSGSVFLRGSFIDGDVMAGGTVTQQHGTTVTGTIAENATIPVTVIPTKTFGVGTQDINIYSGQSVTLAPGQYGDVHLYGNGILSLGSGSYNMRRLIIEASSARLNIDVAEGAVEVNTSETLRIGNQLSMSLLNGTDPHMVSFYTNASDQVVIGTDLVFTGSIVAPNAEVVVYSRTRINGSVYGRRVALDADSQVAGIGCDAVPDGDYPLGFDTQTRTLDGWWPDYNRGDISTVSGIRFGIENVESVPYTVEAKMRLYGPYGIEKIHELGEQTLAPDEDASFFVTATALSLRSETSAMQAQPEIILKRVNMLGQLVEEKRLFPPIYFQHVTGTNYRQIELFDQATLSSQRGGKVAWGPGESVLPGDILGYDSGNPILAGQDARSEILNELGEVVGYRLGTKLGAH